MRSRIWAITSDEFSSLTSRFFSSRVVLGNCASRQSTSQFERMVVHVRRPVLPGKKRNALELRYDEALGSRYLKYRRCGDGAQSQRDHLWRNSRKTECGAKQFLNCLDVRAAPSALSAIT